MADLAVAMQREAVVERLRGGVVLGLEARQHRPGDGEDPEQADHPGNDAQTHYDGAALADAESRSALRVFGHARSSSLRSPESTRSANVAITIEKMTTTIAYADAEP